MLFACDVIEIVQELHGEGECRECGCEPRRSGWRIEPSRFSSKGSN